ncbi:hypothetical protein B0T18DRAFT_174349 [Schizothecium vesticola]|uniref:Uncharacterized protein n=1 Tax=Schizothecium vesticola TaxID=314040 RepID=A0AA40K1Z6_9PEZI|nr:hypothetical protein B0T18DRAFT_174349 [Schizothecium vesticola]
MLEEIDLGRSCSVQRGGRLSGSGYARIQDDILESRMPWPIMVPPIETCRLPRGQDKTRNTAGTWFSIAMTGCRSGFDGLICCQMHQSKIAGTVPPREQQTTGEYLMTAIPHPRACFLRPRLRHRRRCSGGIAGPGRPRTRRGPGIHRPAAGSKLHKLQGPVGRDRHLFNVSGTAAAPKHEVATITPRRRPSSSGDARRPGRRHPPARQPCRAMWLPSQHTTTGPRRQACGWWP